MVRILTYITWSVSPFIYEGEHFAIGWYGTLWTLGLIGLLITLLLAFKHDGVPTQYALITFMVTLVAVIYCGHWADCLFYNWYYVPDDPVHLFGTDWHYRNPKWEHPISFLDIAHGGFASHGTVVGIFVAGLIMARLFNGNIWYVTDRGMIGLCCLGMTVRLGNFINNEICGIETTMPWGVAFGEDVFASHPTQLYEFLTYLLAMCLAWWIFLCKEGGKYKGLLSAIIVAIVMLLRISIEFVKMPQMEIENNWDLNMGQLLSIPLAVWAVWQIFYALQQGKYENIQSITAANRKKQNRRKKK